MRLSTLLDRYFHEAESGMLDNVKSPETIKSTRWTWKMFLSMYDVIYLSDLNEDLFRVFLAHLEFKKKLAPHTIKTYRKNISVFLYWCVRKGYLTKNPIVEAKGPKIENNIPKIYTEEQIDQVFRAIDLEPKSYFERLRNQAIFAVLALTGVRKGELLGLSLSDIDFDNACLKVQASTSKSNVERMIPMTPNLIMLLRKYITERGKYAKPSCDNLWISHLTGIGFTKHGLKHLTEKLSHVVGFSVRPHWFRHSFATYTYAATQDIIAVQKLLGHKNLEITMVYTNVLPENVRYAIERNKLNALFEFN